MLKERVCSGMEWNGMECLDGRMKGKDKMNTVERYYVL